MPVSEQDNTKVAELIAELVARSDVVRDLTVDVQRAVGDRAEVADLPSAVGAVANLRTQVDRLVERLGSLERQLGVRGVAAGTRRGGGARVHDLRGSTQTLSIADLIGMLSVQQATGTLWVHADSERITLEIRGGEIVHMVSDSPRSSSRLGTILVSRRHIDRASLEEFLLKHGATGQPLGELLREAELVSEADLRDALQEQVRALFQRLFQLRDAVFCFRSGEVREHSVTVSMNVTELLLGCARWADEVRRDAAQGQGDVRALFSIEPHPSSVDG